MNDSTCRVEQMYVLDGDVMISTSPSGCRQAGHVRRFGVQLCVEHLFQYIRLRSATDNHCVVAVSVAPSIVWHHV